jgi:peptidoglycan/xylan/chitin deacetylase (PgdA/CDA1 family)
LKGTFFVPIRPTKHGRISEKEIVTLSATQEIGSHGVSHEILTELSLQAAKKEILESKRALERIISKDVSCFCYPKGFYDTAIKNEVEAAGYIAARTVEPFKIDENVDPFAMPTTIQVSRQLGKYTFFCRGKHPPAIMNLAKLNPWLLPLIVSQKPNHLRKSLFDMCLEYGGVFHLWGHAWEVEKLKGWGFLEDIFSHISFRKDVRYVSLGEYIRNKSAPKT